MSKTTQEDHMTAPFSDKKIVEMLVRNDGIKRKDAQAQVKGASWRGKLSILSDQLMRYGDGKRTLDIMRTIGADKERQENAVVLH